MTNEEQCRNPQRRKGRGACHQAVRPLGTWIACKRFGPVTLIALVMLLVFGMGWHRELTLENIVALRDRFHTVLNEHPVRSVLLYFAVYVCAAALSLPGGLILTVAGGLLFGWLLGAIAAVAGATVGATIIFLIARSALGEGLTTRAAPWIAKLRAGFADHALSYLLFLRLVPLFPFWLVNLVPALAGVRLLPFVGATALGIIPGSFAFAFFGSGLDSMLDAQEATHQACRAAGNPTCAFGFDVFALATPRVIAAFIILGLFALLPVVVKHVKASRHHGGHPQA